MTALRRRLRAAGAQVYDSFPEYGKDFRRRLGIESEQAMELFHQTVSMKSVGNLTDFVRDHMLEPFDAAKWTSQHRRALRGSDQGPRGGPAGPGPAGRARPAAGRMRRPRQGRRRDSRADRPADGTEVLLRRPQGWPPGPVALRPFCRTDQPACPANRSRHPAEGLAVARTLPRSGARRSRREPAGRDRPPDQRRRGGVPGPDGPGREVREAARRGRPGSGRDRGALRRPPPPDRRRPRPGQAGPRRRAEPAQRRRVRGQRDSRTRRP